ncbi:MAG: S-methyl-5'-thioadenosine phosphorylase [Phycisphaerales bacterium]|nr:S-methyl-5'-thioadenosine phosphorylase [Phycisphaerales bacterium]
MSEQVIGIIGGTGIGERLAGVEGGERIAMDTPFGRPSGEILKTRIHGVTCLVLSRHGDGHLLNPSVVPYRANIYALKALGATAVVATGATGSLREEIAPGHLVICDQVIDRTTDRARTFFDRDVVAHVEMGEPFCESMRRALIQAADAVETTVHARGTYVCMEGPQFSTRAESMMHRAGGGDLIGMTVMPEAKLAREAELCYALVALPTDYDCWRPHAGGQDKGALLAEIMANMNRASDAALALIREFLRRVSGMSAATCGCPRALELAIWSDRKKVPRAAVERLRPLIGRYFADE